MEQLPIIKGMLVKNRKTGETFFSVFTKNRKGNLRYHDEKGMSLTDKKFSRLYEKCS